MLKIGHRGAKGYVAENTLASFQKAIELGVDIIELDVHLSLDDKIMVIHDETVDRTTTKKGFVNQYKASELQKLGIPLLEDVINLAFRQVILNIELKDHLVYNVVYLIDKYVFEKNWLYEHFQISSFDWKLLEFISTMNRPIALGVLTEDSLDNAIAFAKKINAFSINPYFKLLNDENVLAMHQNGFKIYPWTVNSEEDITFVKSLNVDGIISDFPDRI